LEESQKQKNLDTKEKVPSSKENNPIEVTNHTPEKKIQENETPKDHTPEKEIQHDIIPQKAEEDNSAKKNKENSIVKKSENDVDQKMKSEEKKRKEVTDQEEEITEKGELTPRTVIIDGVEYHLEPKTEHKTLEEDEEVTFVARAILYRFENKEWKERGRGDLKLLKHKQTGKVRLLMRREKIFKICANHYIHPSMELKKKG